MIGWIAAGMLLAGPCAAQQVDHAWARATSPLAQTGAVYLVVHGLAADALTGFSTPAAASAMLHRTSDAHGVMQMRAIDALPIIPGQDIKLTPGGIHIMLMGLTQPLKPGDHFALTLLFAHAAPVTTQVTVERAGAAGPTMDGMAIDAH